MVFVKPSNIFMVSLEIEESLDACRFKGNIESTHDIGIFMTESLEDLYDKRNKLKPYTEDAFRHITHDFLHTIDQACSQITSNFGDQMFWNDLRMRECLHGQ